MLEQEGYQVASNVMFRQVGKFFEIDHLAFKDEEVLMISCKDRSNYQYLPSTYRKIRGAANHLEFRQQLLKISKGRLFIKVKTMYYKTLKERYEGIWTPNTRIIITT
ncbi:MAG: hypothetical protein GF308_07400 [Candidatus Heimdallarchaeota archaeon]|nr:hypothetical protein [Candidatus Heimdallarchaeota archaeon]